jgi:hypothetical protein
MLLHHQIIPIGLVEQVRGIRIGDRFMTQRLQRKILAHEQRVTFGVVGSLIQRRIGATFIQHSRTQLSMVNRVLRLRGIG